MSQTSSFSLPIGPVHVALEEPVYFHLDVDGETVRKVEITSGHVHRGMEGMATQRNFFKNTTLTERVCSLCSNSHSLTYCMAVENVLGMTPPPRAQYLRVLAEETKRVASHLFNIAIFAHNVGFKSLFLHIMEVRENMQDVKETIYGNRMNLSANCIGGVKFDMDDSLTVYMLERLDTVEEAVKRVEKVFRTDPLIAKRSRGVGVLSREDAWALGVVGPVARGSGLDIDVRKNTPYLVYPDLYFDIIKEQDGDVWSRAMVRVREVFESIRLLRQCLDKLPDGPLAVHMERIPESESVARSEAPRGELIYYLQTNGTDTPTRLKWRVPSYMNWEALTVMMKDCQLADIPVIATVVRCDDDAHAKVRAGAKILNIAAGKNTPQVLRELREHYPSLPLIAPGGKTPESIRETIAAGANAIIWTPPSAQQLQTDMMERYRKMKEDATPVISRDDVPIIDQVAAAEVSQVENMNPDVPIPDEVIERVASIHDHIEERRANRGLKPSLHGFFFRGKKR